MEYGTYIKPKAHKLEDGMRMGVGRWNGSWKIGWKLEQEMETGTRVGKWSKGTKYGIRVEIWNKGWNME